MEGLKAITSQARELPSSDEPKGISLMTFAPVKERLTPLTSQCLSSLGRVPSFSDYRNRNDAFMTPDKGFTKQLKKLDPEFEVVWDWGSEKWEIWKFPKELGRESHHVLTVQTKGKSYRQLGTDILVKLQAGQVWNQFTVDQLCDYLEEMETQVRRRKAEAFRDKIEAITRETFNYARGVLQIQVPQEVSVRRAIADA